MSARVITANRLTDGAPVYLGPEACWSVAIEEAEIAGDAAAEQRLAAIAEAAVADRHVVAPYAIEIDTRQGKITPLRLKEAIRAKGPTIPLPNLGHA
jgi:uncharacterized protein DUF2849